MAFSRYRAPSRRAAPSRLCLVDRDPRPIRARRRVPLETSPSGHGAQAGRRSIRRPRERARGADDDYSAGASRAEATVRFLAGNIAVRRRRRAAELRFAQPSRAAGGANGVQPVTRALVAVRRGVQTPRRAETARGLDGVRSGGRESNGMDSSRSYFAELRPRACLVR